MEMIEKTVGKLLEEVAAQYPDDMAVKYNDRPYQRTWKEFDEECVRFAKGLMALGIGKGDHVAIWATNIPQWLITLFACSKIGAVLVTVNTSYKVFELEYLLRQSDTKALVMMDHFKDANYVDIVNELCPKLAHNKVGSGTTINPMLPHLRHVIYVGAQKGEEVPAGMVNWEDLPAMGEEIDHETYEAIYDSLDPDEVINMQYTSGTTGFPKGVMLTHRNIVNNGKAIGDCMNFSHDDRLCIVVPFFHCFGLVLAVMASLTHSTSMVPVEAYRPVDVMKAVAEEECTAVHGVPTMFIGMLEHPDFSKYHFTRLRTGIMAGSPCPIKVMQQVVDQMGMREITITYGQTEASPACTMTTTQDSIETRVATVGRAMPGVECKIIDPETGETLGPGVPGEFCARGYNIMKGYYKMPEATSQAIDKDGWLHTGDLATVDEKGYYKITGRIKDMIIRGGENIYPKEIEEFLYTHPSVKDVQVIGVPSQQYGEEVMACVVLRSEEKAPTEEELKAYVKSHMARHKVPKYIAFMEAFPMTASGKIQKFKLREWAIEYLNLQDAASIETA